MTEVEGIERQAAVYHSQVVRDLVASSVPPSDLRQLRDALPESEDDENWGKLFGVIDSGGWEEGSES